ncbi:conjugal transfer relaxosome DNA-binding protein TraM [Rahnella victoriana]|uniref:conjugal transfer relaxosome DNA-binding protein TraM n=1 Tax=Rahnella victoriana TaxID=1510570 RepID=UPI001E5B8A22|nr:conjugal transfer relaxosome DNA-binding protein TraM [Rahnella victoriana]UHM93595.1 relaxosome protein TraM [Rahnella victoriana]
MPKIQTFVNSVIEQEISNIVRQKKMEGANHFEANVSNVTSMLVELGLRVYKLQGERQEGGFSQVEFNKVLLENVIKSNLVCQKVLAINTQNVEVKGQDELSNLTLIAGQIKNASEAVMDKFFPAEESDAG